MGDTLISKAELSAFKTFRSFVEHSATTHGLDPAVVAGVGSQESAWGTGSDMKPKGPTGTGDRKQRPPTQDRSGPLPPDGQGFGRGLMQIDWDAQPFARTDESKDPAANIDFGCGLLAQNVTFFHGKGVKGADALRAAVAAYNHGPGNVWKNIQNGGMATVDQGTAHGHYSAEVLARAGFYRSHVFGQASAFAAGLDKDRVPHMRVLDSDTDETPAGDGWEASDDENDLLDDITPPITRISDDIDTVASPWPAEGTPEVDTVFGPLVIGSDGQPDAAWEQAHLTLITCPWQLTLAWDHSKTTTRIRCNRQVANSLMRVLDAIWARYGQDQAAITRARMHLYGGCYEFRRKRGLSGLSLHAYGAAIDFDPDGNPMYPAADPIEFQMPAVVVEAFRAEGWKWGNDFKARKDPMHFQATAP